MQIQVNNLVPHDVTSYLCVSEQNTKYLKLHKAKFLLQKTQYYCCVTFYMKIFILMMYLMNILFWLVFILPMLTQQQAQHLTSNTDWCLVVRTTAHQAHRTGTPAYVTYRDAIMRGRSFQRSE